MKVYHGSTSVVKVPDHGYLNFKTDFGKGFYTTSDFNQAKNWSNTKRNRLVEESIPEERIHKYINVYEYTTNDHLNVLDFDTASSDWFLFVFQNRESNKLIHNYDIIKGPVAEDRVFRVLKRYENNMLSVEEAIKQLKSDILSDQISFHTEESLKCLKYIESIEVGETE